MILKRLPKKVEITLRGSTFFPLPVREQVDAGAYGDTLTTLAASIAQRTAYEALGPYPPRLSMDELRMAKSVVIDDVDEFADLRAACVVDSNNVPALLEATASRQIVTWKGFKLVKTNG